MKKILITGASGMLGATLCKVWSDKYDIYSTAGKNFPENDTQNFKEFDLKSDSYYTLSEWVRPAAIIHCAAITSHEYCEANPEEAMVVNGDSVGKLLKYFPDSKLIFISSDAVFPPKTHMAKESDKTRPITVYGQSKKKGESYLMKSKNEGTIVRTTIVGKNLNPARKSFVEWIIGSLRNNKPITLFTDRIFTPISIWHLAHELEYVVENKSQKLLHIGGSEISSKYDFGYGLAKGLREDLSLITKGEMDTKSGVKRSADQTLDSSFFESITDYKLPNLSETIEILVKNFKPNL